MSGKPRKPTNIQDRITNNFNKWAKMSCGEMMGRLLNLYPLAADALEEGDFDGAIKQLEGMVEYIQMFQAPIREKAQEWKNRKYRSGGVVVKFVRRKK